MKSTIRIAFADDHAMFRKGLVSLLHNYPQIEVIIEAADGAELLAQLDTGNQLPDICLLDISMKPMNGYKTAAELSVRYPEVKIIALSMFTDEFSIISMLRNGARGYVSKEDGPERLVEVIAHVVKNGFYLEGINASTVTKAMHGNTISFLDLTKKELELIQLSCSEHTYDIIADKMHISIRTLETYRHNLYKKLDVTTRQGLVLFAMRTGLCVNETRK